MLSTISRSRCVPTRRTSWPPSTSGTLRADAMTPAPRTASRVIAAPECHTRERVEGDVWRYSGPCGPTARCERLGNGAPRVPTDADQPYLLGIDFGTESCRAGL